MLRQRTQNNVLNGYHDRVSIGQSHTTANYVYFVQDFETYYATLVTPISQGNLIVLDGNTSQTLKPSSVQVFYDATPSQIPRPLWTVSTTLLTIRGLSSVASSQHVTTFFRAARGSSQGITVSAAAGMARISRHRHPSSP